MTRNAGIRQFQEERTQKLKAEYDYDKWVRSAKKKTKYVPMGQGLPSECHITVFCAVYAETLFPFRSERHSLQNYMQILINGSHEILYLESTYPERKSGLRINTF